MCRRTLGRSSPRVRRVTVFVFGLFALTSFFAYTLGTVAAQDIPPGEFRPGAPPAATVAPNLKVGYGPAYDAAFGEMLADPANPEKLYRFSEVALQAGDLYGAIAALERLLLVQPNRPDIQLRVAELYQRAQAPSSRPCVFKAGLRIDRRASGRAPKGGDSSARSRAESRYGPTAPPFQRVAVHGRTLGQQRQRRTR